MFNSELKGEEMTLRVSGKNMDVGDALRTRAEIRCDDMVNKYFDRGYNGHLTFEHERSEENTYELQSH